MTLFQCAIGAYFKSIEAVKISDLCGTLAFLVAACEGEADELKKGGAIVSCHTLLTKWASVSNEGSLTSL